MRFNDLIVFAEVTKATSLRSAAEKLNMQPSTISKTIKRIEAHYQQELFNRYPTCWTLTTAGELLLQRAFELIAISDKIERELGQPRRPHMKVSGSTTLLSYFLPNLINQISKQHIDISLETKEFQGLELLHNHDVDMAIVSSQSDLNLTDRYIRAKALSEVNFVTVADSNHPIFTTFDHSISIEKVLRYPFVIPSKPIYGSLDSDRSHDGWHDIEFTRTIKAKVDTAPMLIALVKQQGLLAYVPDYIATEHDLKVINLTKCPYSCRQVVWFCYDKQVTQHWMQHFV
ncbi:LysR family transcriptional regulator [Vibrio harveyi]